MRHRSRGAWSKHLPVLVDVRAVTFPLLVRVDVHEQRGCGDAGGAELAEDLQPIRIHVTPVCEYRGVTNPLERCVSRGTAPITLHRHTTWHRGQVPWRGVSVADA